MSEENKKIEDVKKDGSITHTYATDLAEEIKKGQGSAYRIAMEEEERKEEEKKLSSPWSLQNIIYLLIGIIIIASSILLVSFLLLKNKDVPTPTAPETVNSIISTNINKEIDISKMPSGDIIKAIETEKNEPLDPDTIKNIYFSEKNPAAGLENQPEKIAVDIKKLFFLLNIRIPELLSRSLDNSFLLGVYNGRTFLILKTIAFNNTFRGMKEWEEKMLSYVHNIFFDNFFAGKNFLVFPKLPYNRSVFGNLF